MASRAGAVSELSRGGGFFGRGRRKRRIACGSIAGFVFGGIRLPHGSSSLEGGEAGRPDWRLFDASDAADRAGKGGTGGVWTDGGRGVRREERGAELVD